MLLSGWQVNAENTDEDLIQIYEELKVHWLLTELVLKPDNEYKLLHSLWLPRYLKLFGQLLEKLKFKCTCLKKCKLKSDVKVGKNLESHARQHSPYISSSHEQRGTVVTR